MPSKIKWSALNAAVALLNSDATAPTLKGLTNNSSVLSAEYDNSTNREQLAEFEFLAKCGTAPTGAPYLEAFIVETVDGANYEDGDAATRPARPASFVVPLRAVNTAQRVAVSAIPIPPTKFKLLVVNKAGQDLTSVDGDNGVKMRTYSPEAQ